MFAIKYKITDNIESLRKTSVEDFENKMCGEIRGLFSLDFNGNQFGFYDESLPKSAEGLFEELIILWFQLLNEAIHKLTESRYIALSAIEDCSWIEFKTEYDNFIVSKISMHLNTNNTPFIVTKPNESIEYLGWKNIKIKRKDFINEVIEKTESLIKCIKQINPSLLESSTIIELTKSLEKSKLIQYQG